MLTGFFGAIFVYVVVWHIILPILGNWATMRWNEQSRGQHRHLYRTRPTPKPECTIWQKDCTCPTCNPTEPRAEDQGPYR